MYFIYTVKSWLGIYYIASYLIMGYQKKSKSTWVGKDGVLKTLLEFFIFLILLFHISYLILN